MRFVDELTIPIMAGDGGNGIVAFRRERYQPRGGPCGGDGGRGGDVIFLADRNLGTLLDLKSRPQIKAKRGQDGRGNDCHGRGAEPLVIRVPVGTLFFNDETQELIGDLTEDGQQLVAAAGGQGGLGNMNFATSSNRSPRIAQSGQPGEELVVRLELKLLADVGLLGFPNVGKSTLISRMSAAKPKIADYPFTTIVPNLGVVPLGPGASFVMADIPGIIEGAAQGAGLGFRFLRHVQRSAILLHIVALPETLEDTLLRDFDALSAEVAEFDEKLAKRPRLVALNKADIPEARHAQAAFSKELKVRGFELVTISAATGEGLDTLKAKLGQLLRDTRAAAEENLNDENGCEPFSPHELLDGPTVPHDPESE